MDIVLSEKEVKMRNARLFLKGLIIKKSIMEGMKYSSSKTPSKWFETGMNTSSSVCVTNCHIIYNRMRHDRPHTFSLENDQKILTEWKYDTSVIINILIKNFGQEIVEGLGIEISCFK